MTLTCTVCGRRVGAGRYYRTGDRCNQPVEVTKAAIVPVGRKGDVAWLPRVMRVCAGELRYAPKET